MRTRTIRSRLVGPHHEPPARGRTAQGGAVAHRHRHRRLTNDQRHRQPLDRLRIRQRRQARVVGRHPHRKPDRNHVPLVEVPVRRQLRRRRHERQPGNRPTSRLARINRRRHRRHRYRRHRPTNRYRRSSRRRYRHGRRTNRHCYHGVAAALPVQPARQQGPASAHRWPRVQWGSGGVRGGSSWLSFSGEVMRVDTAAMMTPTTRTAMTSTATTLIAIRASTRRRTARCARLDSAEP